MKLAVLGVILQAASSLTTSLSYIMFKIAMNRNPDRSFICIPRWWIGFLCLMTGALGSVAAITMADISILSMLGSLTLVFNCIFARLILGEKLMLYKIISIVLMCGGVSIGLAVVPYEDHQYTISDLHELFFNRRSYLFWGPTGGLLIAGVLISEWLVKRNQ